MKQFIPLLLLVCCTGVYGQDTAGKFSVGEFKLLDTSFTVSLRYGIPFGYCLDHSPQPRDYRRYKSYRYLINQQPGPKNYLKYVELAGSLWQLNRLAEAEKMFLNIMQSQERHY